MPQASQGNGCTRVAVIGRWFGILLLVLLVSGLVLGQTDSGRVRGTVSDAQGGLIPGATVTLTNTENGRAQTATANSEGGYNFDVVPRGHYKIQTEQKGFKNATAEFTLEVSQVKEVNLQLQVGESSEVVDVSAEVPLIDTESSGTGEVVQGRQITELPLNGRNFTQLALLTPGVTRGDYGNQASGVNNNVETFRSGETGGAALSINGLRPQANNFILDGVDNNESLVNSINFFPPAEAIQEFKVDTSVAPAEFGRAGGGIVQTSIKSGTNEIHGSAFWFIRNSALDANNAYFSPPTDPVTGAVIKSPFKRNQFGGTVGMPILKNKLFIFADYQGLRQDRPLNTEFATVPTDKMRNGDFSELLGTGLTTTPAALTGCGAVVSVNGAIYNPLTCAPFPGNMIPSGQINAAGQKYLKAYPEPNLPGILKNFRAQRRDIRQFNDFDGRLDYNITSKDTAFARYSYGQDIFNLTPRLGTLSSGFGSGNNQNHPRGVAAGEVHSFGTNVVNDFRFGYSRPFYAFINPFNNIAQAQQLGIVNANRTPQLGGTPLIGGFNNEIEFSGDGGPFIVPQTSYQYADTLSWSHGKHSFRFGANIIRRDVDFFISDFRGKGFFNIGPGTGDFTGYEVSELLAGFIDNYSVSVPNTVNTRSWETGYFGQDDWKVSRRLTLNLGLRYDLFTNPYETNNQWSNFDVTTGTLQRAGVNGNSRSLVSTDKNAWAPRIGFAYDLHGHGSTVLRGGYGIFYFLDRGGVGNQLSANPDWSGATSLTAFSGARVTLSGQGPANNNNNAVATQSLPVPVAEAVNDANPTNTAVIAIFPVGKNSTIQQVNLQIGQQLGHNTALNIAWVGTKADHLMTWFNYTNQQLATNSALFPGRGLNVEAGGAIGTSHYSGLQMQLNKRMSHGLQGTVAYTWSHATDNSNGAFSINNSSPIFVDSAGHVLLNQNKGNSDTDQRHAFVGTMIYELPFGHGKQWGSNWSGALNNALGGWQLNNIVSLGTGTPFDITINGVRPDILGPVSTGSLQLVTSGPQAFRTWITAGPSTFALPPQVGGKFIRPGTLGRNHFYGPGYGSWDASLFKNFMLTERVRMQFRAEGFNILNHPQYAFGNFPGNVDLSGANLAQAIPQVAHTNFGLINNTREFSERQIQFAFRFIF
ncbi:MAG TPA: carboxypeptidase regulatory-like domain-containing protein [Candidatus Angelobacter sp.]